MGDAGMASGPPESPRRFASASRRGSGARWNGAGSCADLGGRQALDSLYDAYYLSLVRLAALLTGDALVAEEVAADSLLALIAGPPGIRVPERALFRLRQQVVIRSRRAARVQRTSDRGRHGREAQLSRDPVSGWVSSPVVRVLGSLSASQREAVVLRHYVDLSEKDAAAVMGASEQAVRRSLARAITVLRAAMPDSPEGCKS
jgi:DNA-directed RNA polymerase specialized sigma24 family protein